MQINLSCRTMNQRYTTGVSLSNESAGTSSDIVIVGAGPGGLSLAIELLEMGLDRGRLMVLEKGALPVEAIRKFYPEKKMTLANYKNLPTETHGHLPCFPDLTKAETLTYFNELIKRYQIPIRYQAEVTKVEPMAGGFRVTVGQNFCEARVVAVGIGILGRPNKPDLKIPSSLRKQVLFDLTTVPIKNEKVLVVGGGDSSAEYAQVLVQDSNKVSLAYRGETFRRMLDQNRLALESLAAQNHVDIRMKCEIAEIRDQGGKPEVVWRAGEGRGAETASVAPAVEGAGCVASSAEGNVTSPGERAGCPTTEVFDRIVYAIGGTTPVNFLKTAGIHFENDWPKISATGETNISGLYLLGDLVAGKLGGSIIMAYNASFRSAEAIMRQLA